MVNKLPVAQMQQVSGVNVYVSVVDVDCGGGRGDVVRW